MLSPSRSHLHQVSHKARFWARYFLPFTSDPSKPSLRLTDWTVWCMLMIRNSISFWTRSKAACPFKFGAVYESVFKLSSPVTSWFVTRLRQKFSISHLGSIDILPYQILHLAKTLYPVFPKLVIWELLWIVISSWQTTLTTSAFMHPWCSVTLVESGNILTRVVPSA